jgi:high-affinity iron transporter
MEAVVFVGGVSLGQPATSIPIAAIVGIICGLIIGFIIYEFASRTSKSTYTKKKDRPKFNLCYS